MRLSVVSLSKHDETKIEELGHRLSSCKFSWRDAILISNPVESMSI